MPTPPATLKDWVEMVAAAGGVLGALILFAVNAWTARKDLRRKRAEAGRSLITEMCDDREAKNAFVLLDMENAEGSTARVKDDTGAVLELTWLDVTDALKQPRSTVKGRLVREAFDALFYYFALFDHCINSGLVQFQDVAFPAEYYVKILGSEKAPFETYLKEYELAQAERFLDRWPRWTHPGGT